MRRDALVITLVLAFVLLCQTPASAQVEVSIVGGAVGVASSGGGGAIKTADLRVTTPVNRRFAIEGSIGVSEVEDHEIYGFYGFQIRQRLASPINRRGGIFATYGTIGLYEHQGPYEVRTRDAAGVERVVFRNPGRTDFSLPIVPAVGLAVLRTIGSHAAFRFDAQALVPAWGGVGTRLTAGVAIPMGRYSTN